MNMYNTGTYEVARAYRTPDTEREQNHPSKSSTTNKQRQCANKTVEDKNKNGKINFTSVGSVAMKNVPHRIHSVRTLSFDLNLSGKC